MEEEKLIEKIVQMARINSFSHNREGIEKMCTLLKRELENLNPDSIEKIELTNGPALICRKRADAKRQIYLGGHMDTVFPENWDVRHERGKLFGPGVCDMKGGLVILLESLRRFEACKEKEELGWVVLLNPDEEIGSPFSAPLIRKHAKKCLCALIFEPSLPNHHLVSARKGSVNYRCTAKGRAAHVGRDPEKGVCAITKLAHFITDVEKLNSKTTRLFIGKMSGGVAGNVVAAHAECLLNIRFKNSFPENRVRASAKKWGIKLDQINFRPPKPFEKKTKQLFMAVRGCAKSLGDTLDWEESGGVCDGNEAQSVGTPTIDTLGGEGGMIHTQEEFLITKSIEKKAAWTHLLLCQLATGEIQL
ncbi:MAG: M20/M25/M40 family metallo-hydrolase [Chlamydiales bacterium]|nr:M20/M25/M40 family metallo-hydrolase [Chlamydiales bacterium]